MITYYLYNNIFSDLTKCRTVIYKKNLNEDLTNSESRLPFEAFGLTSKYLFSIFLICTSEYYRFLSNH